MKRSICATAAAIACCLCLVDASADPNSGVGAFMRPKLLHSQRLLEGLSLENFGLIASEARALRSLSEAAEWQVLPSIEYVTFSGDFQRNCNELVRHANEKNLDGASLAYLKLTLNCIECHKHVRQHRAQKK